MNDLFGVSYLLQTIHCLSLLAHVPPLSFLLRAAWAMRSHDSVATARLDLPLPYTLHQTNPASPPPEISPCTVPILGYPPPVVAGQLISPFLAKEKKNNPSLSLPSTLYTTQSLIGGRMRRAPCAPARIGRMYVLHCLPFTALVSFVLLVARVCLAAAAFLLCAALGFQLGQTTRS
ncbi:hypothetical protein GGR50DRAFT_17491 [Xylaria sp. CBS 124048]|nr:hypothetical protein GGR50DRAFT_17491 [Xylaria sp. CBS 124048]